MKKIFFLAISLFVFVSCVSKKDKFQISSPDFNNNEKLSKKFEFDKFGCDGENFAPILTWQNAPENTKSFALNVHDEDAPTGSGWWHFSAYDIDKNLNKINLAKLPKNINLAKNDAGFKGYMGACPPKNHGIHHYDFEIFALDTSKLKLDKNASPALVGYMINMHKIDSAKITAVYER